MNVNRLQIVFFSISLAALIASGFRYSLSLNKAHSKHRALPANRLHFGVVDKSYDYLPSAKAYLRHPRPSRAKCLSVSCAVSRRALLAFRTLGASADRLPCLHLVPQRPDI